MSIAMALTLCAVAVLLTSAGRTPSADAAAVGVKCRPVTAGGYSATHVFVDYMTCHSARTKLRRWLPRDRLPRNPNGWYCYRLGGVVRVCGYPGRTNARKDFTFWLRRN
jgi:hypothetical protein